MTGSTRVLVKGPLGPFVEGFTTFLVEEGHSRRSVQGHLRRVRHMSGWMTAVEAFLAERRRQGQAVMISPRGSRPLLSYLEGLGVLPSEDRVPSSAELLLEDFRAYLLDERGLQANTASLYENAARLFFAERSEPLGDDLARRTGAEITAFVLERSRRGERDDGLDRDLRAAGSARVPALAGRYSSLAGFGGAVCGPARELASAGA